MLALGHEILRTEDAVLVRNRDLPDIWDANHAQHVGAATPAAIDRLLARMDEVYAASGHRRLDCDFTTPPGLEARLVLDGFHRRDFLVMLLEGEPRGRAGTPDIRACADAAGWKAFTALKVADWKELAGRVDLAPSDTVGEALARTARLRAPAVRYWLAFDGGEPRGFLCSWEGVDGVGQVEDLYVHPTARGRGIAAALLHHGIADCRRHGARAVVIVADAGDTPKAAYARMGFAPVAVKREYVRRVTR
ncbi:MAG TPA: GNAT family N-acetyltransferase [Candidatus Binatia bacterium]|nr:GNAT family N-acetyltransferase [Candidatus Binatia bacterium]